MKGAASWKRFPSFRLVPMINGTLLNCPEAINFSGTSSSPVEEPSIAAPNGITGSKSGRCMKSMSSRSTVVLNDACALPVFAVTSFRMVLSVMFAV